MSRIGYKVVLHHQVYKVGTSQRDPVARHGKRPSELEHLRHRVVVDGDDPIDVADIRLGELLPSLSVRWKVGKEVGIDEAPTRVGYELTNWPRWGYIARLTGCCTRANEIGGVSAFDQLQRAQVGLQDAVGADEAPSGT